MFLKEEKLKLNILGFSSFNFDNYTEHRVLSLVAFITHKLLKPYISMIRTQFELAQCTTEI